MAKKTAKKSGKTSARKASKKRVVKKPARKASAKRTAKKPARKAAAKRTVKKPARKAAAKRTVKPVGVHRPVKHPELSERVPRDEVREIFRTYDRDASGFIDRGELARLLEALGAAPSEEELAVAVDVIDANHSGRISWDEFNAWWRSR